MIQLWTDAAAISVPVRAPGLSPSTSTQVIAGQAKLPPQEIQLAAQSTGPDPVNYRAVDHWVAALIDTRLIEIDLGRITTAFELHKHEACLRRAIELPHAERSKQNGYAQSRHQ